MKRIIILVAFAAFAAQEARSQVYGKINAMYAMVGIINPQLEMKLTDHSTFQSEVVVSPWKSVTIGSKSRPFMFGLLLNEYKYFFRQANNGWYAAGNAGVMGFRMSKPIFDNGIGFQERYGKGWGVQVAVGGGYQRQFGDRWLLDCFLTFGYYLSHYNSYHPNGEVEMYPGHMREPEFPDPWNASAEWLPNKAGISIGYLLFAPNR